MLLKRFLHVMCHIVLWGFNILAKVEPAPPSNILIFSSMDEHPCSWNSTMLLANVL